LKEEVAADGNEKGEDPTTVEPKGEDPNGAGAAEGGTVVYPKGDDPNEVGAGGARVGAEAGAGAGVG
jgi:hypothetical protein